MIKIGQHLLVPQRTVFLRFKQEGVILFGREIREESENKAKSKDFVAGIYAAFGEDSTVKA